MMKCKMCGTVFEKGIFCPECGTRIEIDTKTIKDNETNFNEEQENEKQKIEVERLKQENEKQKIEVERLKQENERRDREKRVVHGKEYGTIEEAEIAELEHNKIELLKSQMLLTKSQEKRREIVEKFNYDFQTSDAKKRFDLLKAKANVETPISEKVNLFYGLSVLVTFFLGTIFPSLFGNGEINIFSAVCIAWAGFGVWIWPIWKVVQIVKRKDENHYSNIKNI